MELAKQKIDTAEAVEVVRSVLSCAGYRVDDLIVKSTGEYSTIEKLGEYPFCRLKLDGNLPYISLCIGAFDDVERLSLLPAYANLKRSNEKFTKFYISTIEDILKYSDGIVSAYRFICRIPSRSPSGPSGDIEGDLRSFLGMIERYSSGSTKYSINHNEEAFFKAYLSLLIENGVDWLKLRPYRTADGSISVCGGVIRLQGRKTYMIYFQGGGDIRHKVDNRPLEEYISLQSNWVLFCKNNPDLLSF